MGQSSDSIHHNAQDTDPSLVTLCFCTRGRLISTGSTSCHCSCMHVKCAAGYVTAGCRRSRLKCGLGVRPYSTKGCSKRTCCRPRNPRDRAATRAAVGTRADRRPLLACQSQTRDDPHSEPRRGSRGAGLSVLSRSRATLELYPASAVSHLSLVRNNQISRALNKLVAQVA